MENNLNIFIGKTFSDIVVSEDKEEIIFTVSDKEKYKMCHYQDCCEHVYCEDIVGDLKDLIDSPIIKAEGRTSDENPKDKEWDESFTWTFYELASIKGSVSIRWYGTSNGYYSESVDIELMS